MTPNVIYVPYSAKGSPPLVLTLAVGPAVVRSLAFGCLALGPSVKLSLAFGCPVVGDLPNGPPMVRSLAFGSSAVGSPAVGSCIRMKVSTTTSISCAGEICD